MLSLFAPRAISRRILNALAPRILSFHSGRSREPFASPLPQSGTPVVEYFGTNVFDQRAMRDHVSGSVLDSFFSSVENGEPVTATTADALAKSMLKWALERGATHYSHWFQPLTGTPAEKHDTFLDPDHTGIPITRFRGKDLIMAEPDGSSFPTGGLRETHVARGYTVWDVNSPPFILRNGNGATLYIPSVFFSWEHDRALDDKTPLLRSDVALSRETRRLFNVLGEKQHKKFFTDSGLEQEYFLIERKYFLRRLDLQTCGRTLQGAPSPKGQELEDQYFGHISQRYLNAIHEFEVEMWKLGVPIMTRHREVAPGQYETAPKFARSSVATDRNLLMMEVLRKTAIKHGLAALLHEKPFKGVNGSGKHNNWSFGTNSVPSLLDPGSTPHQNISFLFFLACTVRAVDKHADLLRIAIAGASNDHRLGANEAPPAIVSIYLGDDVGDAVDKFVDNNKNPRQIELTIDLGVPSLPIIRRQATDRNRTSTFAFTGNKFEFRAVGSSQNPSRSNMTLNTIMAESVRDLSTKLEAELKSGKNKDQAMEKVARETLLAHKRIIFNGNGYSPEWQVEAKKRGLWNLKTTPEALKELSQKKNIKLFSEMKVLNEAELKARKHVFEEEYFKKIAIEAKTLRHMAHNQILPAAARYATELATSAAHLKDSKHLGNALKTLSSTLDSAYGGLAHLEHKLKDGYKEHGHTEEGAGNSVQAAEFAEKSLLPSMNELRESLDKLETLVASDRWPIPTYHEMLFHQE